MRSAVGYLQLYSYKSQTSLSSGFLVFHSIHITLSILLEGSRRRRITNSFMLLAYLPAGFNTGSCGRVREGRISVSKYSINRIRALLTLHECIELAQKKLAQVPRTGLECFTKDGERLVFHCIPNLYMGDIPECENFLSVKRENRTKYPCHLCTA